MPYPLLSERVIVKHDVNGIHNFFETDKSDLSILNLDGQQFYNQIIGEHKTCIPAEHVVFDQEKEIQMLTQ